MLSALQRGQVWEGWLAAEVRALYFADLCHRYQRAQRTITWATLAASSGATASLIAELPADLLPWRVVLALLATLLTLWSLVFNYNKNTTDCSDLHLRWNKLGMEYAALWNDMYTPEAPRLLNELRNREADLAKASNAFPNRERLMRRWQAHVVNHRRQEQAA